VFADNETAEITPTELHAGFRLNATSGSVTLARPQGAQLAIVDYLDYSGLAANTSLASVPDGQSFAREALVEPTPGMENGGAEPNRPPVLTAIGNRNATVGALLAFTATATDPDDGQSLTFALAGTVPAGAAITPAGAFTWTPGAAQTGPHTFRVVVTDNGSPTLADEEQITVTVAAPPAAPTPVPSVDAPDLLTLTWATQNGVNYRVEYRDTISGAWQTLRTIIGNGSVMSTTDDLTGRVERYYRLVIP